MNRHRPRRHRQTFEKRPATKVVVYGYGQNHDPTLNYTRADIRAAFTGQTLGADDVATRRPPCEGPPDSGEKHPLGPADRELVALAARPRWFVVDGLQPRLPLVVGVEGEGGPLVARPA